MLRRDAEYLAKPSSDEDWKVDKCPLHLKKLP